MSEDDASPTGSTVERDPDRGRSRSFDPDRDGNASRRHVLRGIAGAGVASIGGTALLPEPSAADSDVSIAVSSAGGTTLSPGDELELDVTATNDTDGTDELLVHYPEVPPCCYVETGAKPRPSGLSLTHKSIRQHGVSQSPETTSIPRFGGRAQGTK